MNSCGTCLPYILQNVFLPAPFSSECFAALPYILENVFQVCKEEQQSTLTKKALKEEHSQAEAQAQTAHDTKGYQTEFTDILRRYTLTKKALEEEHSQAEAQAQTAHDTKYKEIVKGYQKELTDYLRRSTLTLEGEHSQVCKAEKEMEALVKALADFFDAQEILEQELVALFWKELPTKEYEANTEVEVNGSRHIF